MLFYAIQIIISLIACYYYRKNRLRYYSLITAAYFISYYTSGSFDVALTLYCVFIIFGTGMPDKFSLSDILFSVWILIYVLAGLMFQDAFSTMSALVTRYGFIVVCIYMNCAKINSSEWIASTSDYRFAIKVGMLTELLIIMLVWSEEGIGARVVANNQPIGAGMATALITIIGWCYLSKHFTSIETIIYSILCIIIVILSGTRGYMVIISFGLVVIMCAYLLDVPQNGQKIYYRIGTFLVLASFIVLGLLLVEQEVWVQLLRLDAGLGYRENENFYVREILKVAPWYNQLFGFGFGGIANHLDEFLTVVHQASWNRKWMSIKLLNKSIFHNYWYTVMFKQGIVGLVFIILFLVSLVKKILNLNTNIWKKLLLALLLVGNMISQTYRITATCSIYEILLIMFFVKLIESENDVTENETRIK